MSPYLGPEHSGMFLPCEVARLPGGALAPAASLLARTGRGGDRNLDLYLLDALRTTTAPGETDSPVNAATTATDGHPSSHLVRCVYSDVHLRERLAHPQALVTTLTSNYRSHPALLMLPSLLFYGGSLESRAPPVLTSSCLSWSWLSQGSAHSSASAGLPDAFAAAAKPLRENGFPLLCLGVVGVDAHLVDSPSFWNLAEVDAVCGAIASLLSEARAARSAGSSSLLADLTELDIGVIAPYRQQVLRLRKALRCGFPRESLALSTPSKHPLSPSCHVFPVQIC